ncbi:MAG: AI-2E family transporter [Burkholderiales bacterium]|nr:AI-2E family transporter [Burkholderiales bacterium]
MSDGQRNDLHYLFLLGLAVLGAALLYLLSPILAPFLFAAILAYICDPMVDRLQRRRVPRTGATLLVLLLLVVLLSALALILLPLIVKETTLLIERMPGVIERINGELLPWLREQTGTQIQLEAATVKAWLSEGLKGSEDLPQRILSSVTLGGMAIAGFLVNLVLVPVVLFYLLRDWDLLLERIDQLIPRRWHQRIAALAREVDAVLAEFLRGQLSVMLLMSVYYCFALWLAGLEFALPIGVVTGILVFVPYLGVAIGLVLATVTALMQFGSLAGALPVWIAIGIGQLLEGFVVTPWLVGDRIGLHPVVVIFALLAFGQLFGFFGVLLALPASAMLLVWLRHVRTDYLASQIYHS